MTARDDGGPAFPHWDDHSCQLFTGMSLRDYFAAAAMQAFVSGWTAGTTNLVAQSDSIAKTAYDMADAMLRERAK